MAKKKKQEIVAEVATEEIIEEVVEEESVTENVTEEVSEEVADAMIEEEVIEEKKSDDEQFIFAQLKAINKSNNPAKAKRLADRVLRNRKR